MIFTASHDGAAAFTAAAGTAAARALIFVFIDIFFLFNAIL